MKNICIICDGNKIIVKVKETAEVLQKNLADIIDNNEIWTIVQDNSYESMRNIFLKANKISAIYDITKEIEQSKANSEIDLDKIIQEVGNGMKDGLKNIQESLKR